MTAVMTTMGGEVSRNDGTLERLVSSLRSDDLRELAKNKYKDMSNEEFAKAKAAADFFADLGAQEVLFEGLDHRNYKLKAHIALLLADLVKKGDAEALRSLLPKLEGTLTLISWGTEIELLRSEYRKNLLQAISVIIGQDLADIDPSSEGDLKKVIEAAQKYLDDEMNRR